MPSHASHPHQHANRHRKSMARARACKDAAICKSTALQTHIETHHSSFSKCHKETTNAHLTAAEEVELVDAIVHALHVLEDIGPGVRRRTKGRQVAGLLQATKQVSRKHGKKEKETKCTQRAGRLRTGGLGMPTKPRYWSSLTPVTGAPCSEMSTT